MYIGEAPSNSIYSKLSKEDFLKHYNGKAVPMNFTYNSGDNEKWETIESLRSLIKTHIDNNFIHEDNYLIYVIHRLLLRVLYK